MALRLIRVEFIGYCCEEVGVAVLRVRFWKCVIRR